MPYNIVIITTYNNKLMPFDTKIFKPLQVIRTAITEISNSMNFIIENNKILSKKIEEYTDEFRANTILDSYSTVLGGLQDKTCQNLEAT